MLRKLNQKFRDKGKQPDRNGGNTTMPVLAPAKIPYGSVDELIERSKHLVVRRVGKDIVLVDDKHAHVLSGEKIESIVKAVIESNATTKIRTSGLSKAQVEKIAGSFVRDNAVVEVRHVSRQRKTSNQLQRFEIVVKGGKNIG